MLGVTVALAASLGEQIDASYVPVPNESFSDRRRIFELQEIILPRLRPPERLRPIEPRTKKARTEREIDLEFYGFDFFQTPIPEGWHYDKSSNEFHLGETQDFWSFEDDFLVRKHMLGRNESYRAEQFLIAQEELQTVHGLTLQNDCRTIYVNGSEPSYFEHQWLGKTLYPLIKQAAESRGIHYIGDFSDKIKRCRKFRGRGHVWATTGSLKKKQAKESADLFERYMKLEDRLAFLEGKKAELASIFENGVWEVELDPQCVDHSRVMKAHFVLKWTTDSKGNPRAKARLVLQGFADPDLLRGGFDTLSPTLNRTSR